MKTAIVPAALYAAALAVPASAQVCPYIPQNANFDDLGGTPGSFINTIPTPYRGLNYQGIGLPGVVPHSGDNYARAGVTSELQGTSTLTVNFPASNTEAFRLQNFYYGCTLQGTGVAAVPFKCTITITGYTGSDNTVADSRQVCSQTYEYDPTTLLGQQQQAFGRFDNCEGRDLQFARIAYSLPGGAKPLNPLSVLVIDDLRYLTRARTC